MLTAELLRYRIEGDEVFPFRIDARKEHLAGGVQEVFRKASGRRRAELNAGLQRFEREGQDVFLVRCFAKLLQERSTFILKSLLNPEEVRCRVFAKAAKRPFLRWGDDEAIEVLRETAREFTVDVCEVERALFADLPEEAVLIEYRRPPRGWLVDRFNLAQAQGLLYFATRLRCRFEGELRKVFTHIRLSRLMYRLKDLSMGRYDAVVDGPVSGLKVTSRYGVRMARLLPALCMTRSFDLEAALSLRGQRLKLRLSTDTGLRSHYKASPPFDSRIEETFAKRFAEMGSSWAIEREGEVIDLGDEIMIPDFTFRHADGRVRHLEIVGFWTPGYLERKLKKVKRAAGRGLLVAASSKLAREERDFPKEAIWFKTALDPKTVLHRLDNEGASGRELNLRSGA